MNIEVVLITVVISFYLYYKKRKEDNLNEEKTTEFYKNIYKPVQLDSRISTISRDGWELEDAVLIATECIYEALLPSEAEINSLIKGDLTKLKFVDKNNEIERMWVEYLRKEDNLHLGILKNNSFENNELIYGKFIYFHSNHVFVMFVISKN